MKTLIKEQFYFVHSYIANTIDPNDTIAFSKISNIKIPAVINHKNITGFQFHPEKSSKDVVELINLFSRKNNEKYNMKIKDLLIINPDLLCLETRYNQIFMIFILTNKNFFKK